MADLTPNGYPDGTVEEQLRYAKQAYAEAMRGKSVSSPDGRSVVRQNLSELAAEIKRLEQEVARANRMHVVYARHGRR